MTMTHPLYLTLKDLDKDEDDDSGNVRNMGGSPIQMHQHANIKWERVLRSCCANFDHHFRKALP
jgi:hypothetical protein